MIRARIIVRGKVQRVGFREIVQEMAREHGIVGRVRNLKTGEVKVICEGERREIENFISAIEIKDGLVEVKEIIKTLEESTGEFKYFEIEYGELAEELTESIGAGRRELVAIRETMDTDFKTLGEKMDSVGKNVVDVGEKIDTGFSKTDSNFKDLGEKTDSVGKNVVDVGEKIDAGFSKTDSNFKDLDGKYDVVSRELKAMNENISRLVGYVGTLVEDAGERGKGVMMGGEVDEYYKVS